MPRVFQLHQNGKKQKYWQPLLFDFRWKNHFKKYVLKLTLFEVNFVEVWNLISLPNTNLRKKNGEKVYIKTAM